MILGAATLLLVALIDASAPPALETNSWVDVCMRGRLHKMKSVNCEQLGSPGLLHCLMNSDHDRTMARAITMCPHKLPVEGARFGELAARLYQRGYKRAFRKLISDNRCAHIPPAAVGELLSKFVGDQHSVPYVRAMVRHCVLGNAAWTDFMNKAQAHGRGELVVVVQETRPLPTAAKVDARPVAAQVVPAAAVNAAPPAAPISPVSGASDPYPAGPFNGAFAGSAPSAETLKLSTAREEYDAAQKRMAIMRAANITGKAPSAQPAVVGPYTGELLRITPEYVAANPQILAQITPCQARKFGLLSCGCMGLTDAHFRAPGVSSRVVARLPLNCFQKIPPAAFGGMNACMVARIRWWPYVTREQVSYVPVGDPIRALPFDMLGMGRQKSKEDKMHPCWAITRDQLASIRKSKTARREYHRRCIKSAAGAARALSVVGCAVLLCAGALL